MGSIWRGMDDVTFSALLAIGIEAAAWNYCVSSTTLPPSSSRRLLASRGQCPCMRLSVNSPYRVPRHVSQRSHKLSTGAGTTDVPV